MYNSPFDAIYPVDLTPSRGCVLDTLTEKYGLGYEYFQQTLYEMLRLATPKILWYNAWTVEPP